MGRGSRIALSRGCELRRVQVRTRSRALRGTTSAVVELAKSRGITFHALAARWFNAVHETLSLTSADARSFIAAKSQIQCFLHECLGLSIDIVIAKSQDSPLIPGLVPPNGVPNLSHHTPDLVRCRPRSRHHPENDDLPLHLAQSSAPHLYGPLPVLICRSCVGFGILMLWKGCKYSCG